MLPLESDAVALRATLAGALYVAPLAGAVSETVGAWFVAVETVTLSNAAVAVWAGSPLATARPTTTSVALTDIVPIAVHATPSADCDAVSVVPRRSSRTQYGAATAVPVVLVRAAPVVSR